MFANILIGILIFMGGLIAGFFISRFVIKREFEKNPPISEDVIEAMLKSMGQPASKKHVKKVMNSMKNAGK